MERTAEMKPQREIEKEKEREREGMETCSIRNAKGTAEYKITDGAHQLDYML